MAVVCGRCPATAASAGSETAEQADIAALLNPFTATLTAHAVT